ncbi:MAG: histidinol-phosphatase HisJ family protein [Methylacidiphilales bacterium]|nr:histidinol-phosphatase HisJ family protein [Candidatus Methylacidiphilales bacterium]MDW8349465.1 histidinol-phosphatase HisJ family protein [Verrucomicrobiae bacterium]
MIADYHTHPQGHRLQRYDMELLKPWAERALAQGIREIAFTDHDRYCDGVALEAVDQLAEAYPQVRFLKGIELDNDPVTGERGRRWVEEHWEELDYVLGSIHYLPGEAVMFDSLEGASQFDRHGVERAYELYVAELEKMMAYGAVDCFSHLDLVKIHGHRVSEEVNQKLFVPLLERIAKAGKSIEINTAGWRKPVGECYPSLELIREAVKLGVTITISSDAHSYAQLGEGYERLREVLQAAGVKEIALYQRHQRRLTAWDRET